MKKKTEVREYKSAGGATRGMLSGTNAAIFRGDCFELVSKLPDASIDLVITSPPYCMGMEYERSRAVQEFINTHKKMLPEIVRVTKPGGSICWRVGYHISKRGAFPLDYAVFSILGQRRSCFEEQNYLVICAWAT